jgi:hypothetical protein
MTFLCERVPRPYMSNTSTVNPKGGKTTISHTGKGGGGLRKYGGCGAVQPGRRVGGGGVEPPVGGGTPSRDLAGSCLPSLSASAALYTVQ